MWQLKAAYIIPIVEFTTAIPNILHEILKLPNFRRALYILMQKTVVLNACCTVSKFWQNSEQEVLRE
jgi:hypothetical protein